MRRFLGATPSGSSVSAVNLMGDERRPTERRRVAARLSGLDAGTIERLALRMAATRTFITTTWSLQRADHGEQPIWMTIVLAAMLGQIGLPGGGFGIGYGSVNRMGASRSPAPTLNRPYGKSPARSYIPVARIADLLLNPAPPTIDYNGERITFPDIKLVYWCGGNPFHHHQDINRLVKAWQRPETVIVNEIWWTPTALHADIVLPATTTLERNDIGASADRYMFAMHQAIAPVGECPQRFSISSRRWRGGSASATPSRKGRGEMEWLRHLYDVYRQQASRSASSVPISRLLAGRLRGGPRARPLRSAVRLSCRPGRTAAQDAVGRIEIYSERVASFGYDDCPGHPTWMEPAEWLGSRNAGAGRLHLVSNQPTARLHGQLDNGPVSQATKVRGREPLWINPRDAADRKIARRRRGPRVQRAWRLPRRRGRDRCDQPGRRAVAGPAPGTTRTRRPHRGARSSRQPQHADARQGHVEARAGAECADRAGRGRALAGPVPEIGAYGRPRPAPA